MADNVIPIKDGNAVIREACRNAQLNSDTAGTHLGFIAYARPDATANNLKHYEKAVELLNTALSQLEAVRDLVGEPDAPADQQD